jgi:hypothetical protein
MRDAYALIIAPVVATALAASSAQSRSIFSGSGERHPNDVIVRVWKVE